jgi:hypothetical protein
MAEHAKEDEEGQQPDSEWAGTQAAGLPQARLGHNHHHRDRRRLIRDAGAGIMKFYRWYEQCGTYSTYNTHSCKIYIR